MRQIFGAGAAVWPGAGDLPGAARGRSANRPHTGTPERFSRKRDRPDCAAYLPNADL